MMKPKRCRVNITLQEDVIMEMYRKANREGRSLSGLINIILRRYLEREGGLKPAEEGGAADET